MTILASDITVRLSKTLHDMSNERWELDEMYRAIDDAQKALLEVRPDLYEVTDNVQLKGLGPKQERPDECYKIFDITYNVNDEMLPVSIITKVERSMMDRTLGTWMAEANDSRLEHWMQAPREKEIFWVYPPAGNDKDTGQPPWVVMRFAKRPAIITDAADELPVPDEMINALYYFAMTRCFEKDEKFAGSEQAKMFLDKFALMVGARTGGDSEEDQLRVAREKT